MPQVHEDTRAIIGAQEMPHCPHWWAQVRKASTPTFTVFSTSNIVGTRTEGSKPEKISKVSENPDLGLLLSR